MKKEKDPAAVAVGRRIRLARQSRGMTLEQLAEAAETSSQFLSQIEKGEQNMTTLKFGRLALALRVSSDYLLYGRDSLGDFVGLAAKFLGGLSPIEREMVAQVVVNLQGVLDAMRPENE